jgi:hypothetical protein
MQAESKFLVLRCGIANLCFDHFELRVLAPRHGRLIISAKEGRKSGKKGNEEAKEERLWIDKNDRY